MIQRIRTFVAAPTTPLLLVAVAMVCGSVLLNFGIGSSSGTPEPVACEPIPVVLEGKVAILRVDDVQGWAWGETTRLMIDDALSRGAVLTLGVIPKHLDSDPHLLTFLRARLCNLEIALHGWDHAVLSDGVTPEFATLEREPAKERLEQGLAVLKANFESDVKTWIPPQNMHSTGTVEAVRELGLTRSSTEGSAVWDYDATTWDYDTNELVRPEDTLAACEESVASSGMCIIMLHPQNYAIYDEYNEELYTGYYLALLDLLQLHGYTFARFADVDAGTDW